MNTDNLKTTAKLHKTCGLIQKCMTFYVQHKYNLHYCVQSWLLGKGINLCKLSAFIKFTPSLLHLSFKQNLAHGFCTAVWGNLHKGVALGITVIERGVWNCVGGGDRSPLAGRTCVCIEHCASRGVCGRGGDATCLFLPLTSCPNRFGLTVEQQMPR